MTTLVTQVFYTADHKCDRQICDPTLSIMQTSAMTLNHDCSLFIQILLVLYSMPNASLVTARSHCYLVPSTVSTWRMETPLYNNGVERFSFIHFFGYRSDSPPTFGASWFTYTQNHCTRQQSNLDNFCRKIQNLVKHARLLIQSGR